MVRLNHAATDLVVSIPVSGGMVRVYKGCEPGLNGARTIEAHKTNGPQVGPVGVNFCDASKDRHPRSEDTGE